MVVLDVGSLVPIQFRDDNKEEKLDSESLLFATARDRKIVNYSSGHVVYQ